jgi:glutamyl-tRNA reductase
MHLVVVGISHKTAALELRERLALSSDAAARFGRGLLEDEAVAEAVVLSTCNRTEAYLFAGDTLAAERLSVERLAELGGVAAAELRAAAYSYSGDAAIGHLFRVAASLDSMVVGEAQILAQLKDAYQSACGEGCTSTVFNKLFRHALEVGKRVRTETAIGEKPVSISSVAVDLARQVLGKLDRRSVLVLGAGEMSELTVKHLQGQGVGSVTVANRTLETAEELARRCEGQAVCLDELDERLAVADIVISSTAAPEFILDRPQMERVMRRRRHDPMFLIDIAVPRDLDPEIAHIHECYLYDIDDLQSVVEANRHERERETAHAERIVNEELARMNEWLAGLEVVPTIALLRSAVDGIREAELQRLGSKLESLSPEQRAQVEQLTSSIVNKILHLPTVRMKELAAEKDAYVYVDALRHLFDLDGATPAQACDLEQDWRAAAGDEAVAERLAAPEPAPPECVSDGRDPGPPHEAGDAQAATPAAEPAAAADPARTSRAS